MKDLETGFSRNRSNRDGRECACRSCEAARVSLYNQGHREQIRRSMAARRKRPAPVRTTAMKTTADPASLYVLHARANPGGRVHALRETGPGTADGACRLYRKDGRPVTFTSGPVDCLNCLRVLRDEEAPYDQHVTVLAVPAGATAFTLRVRVSEHSKVHALHRDYPGQEGPALACRYGYRWQGYRPSDLTVTRTQEPVDCSTCLLVLRGVWPWQSGNRPPAGPAANGHGPAAPAAVTPAPGSSADMQALIRLLEKSEDARRGHEETSRRRGGLIGHLEQDLAKSREANQALVSERDSALRAAGAARTESVKVAGERNAARREAELARAELSVLRAQAIAVMQEAKRRNTALGDELEAARAERDALLPLIPWYRRRNRSGPDQ